MTILRVSETTKTTFYKTILHIFGRVVDMSRRKQSKQSKQRKSRKRR